MTWCLNEPAPHKFRSIFVFNTEWQLTTLECGSSMAHWFVRWSFDAQCSDWCSDTGHRLVVLRIMWSSTAGMDKTLPILATRFIFRSITSRIASFLFATMGWVQNVIFWNDPSKWIFILNKMESVSALSVTCEDNFKNHFKNMFTSQRIFYWCNSPMSISLLRSIAFSSDLNNT